MRNKQAIQSFVGNFVYLLAQWVMTVVVVRFTDDFLMAGILSLATSLSNVFYIVASYGMRSFQVSDITKKYTDQSYVLSRLVTVSVALLACIVYTIAMGYPASTIIAILIFMGYKSFEAVSDVMYGIFQANDRFDSICISMSVKGVISISVFTLLIAIGCSLIVALSGILAVAFLTFALYDVRIGRKYTVPLISFDKGIFKAVFSLLIESFLMVILLIVQPLLLAITRVYFEKNFSTELLGAYSSVSAPTLVIPTFVTCVMMPFVPLFAKYFKDKNKIKLTKVTFASVGFAAVVGAAALVFSVFFGKWLLSVLYGSSIIPYADVFNLIIIVTTMTTMIICLEFSFIAARKLIGLSIVLLLGCLLGYVISPWFIDTYAMQGITYVLMIAQGFQFVGALVLFSRIVKNMDKEKELKAN